MATEQQSSTCSYPGMEQWRGKCALVTGASSGIGYDVARRLAELGMNVVGCSRNITKIEVCSVHIWRALACDVTTIYTLH